MTEIAKQMSLVELEERSDEGKREMSAARAGVRVTNLLRKAFRLTKSSQRKLAERLGVSEGRVSQVLNSDGNLRITTIARYLRAMGYELQLEAIPVERGVPDLRTTRHSRRNKKPVHVFGNTNSGSNEQTTVILTDSPHIKNLSLESMHYLGQFQHQGTSSGSASYWAQRHAMNGFIQYELV